LLTYIWDQLFLESIMNIFSRATRAGIRDGANLHEVERFIPVRFSNAPRQLRQLQRLERARALIRSRFYDDLDLAALARAASMSEFHFSRVYRAQFGCSPMQELNQHRVELCKHLLASTRIPVGDIALTVGYQNRTTLFRQFRGCTGVSPKRYRLVGPAASMPPKAAQVRAG
jgi:AraC-like DNA-binding protein